MKKEGISVVFISHKLDEVFRICDRVTVFRDGTFIGCEDIHAVDQETLIKMMVGREMKDMYPKEAVDIGEVVLRVQHL